MTDPEPSARGRAGLLRRASRVLLIGLLAVAVAGMTGWSALFLWLSPLPGEHLRLALASAFIVATAGSFMFLSRRRRTLAWFLVVFAGLVAWYFSIRPSNQRDWAIDVARLPTATINGDIVEIRNIRNFDYRSKQDFTAWYCDRSFDLNDLESVDLVSVTWGSPAIAHIMTSFGFGEGDFIAFSIEMRRENGERGSMIRSFFRHYELIYVVADERDLIRLRTNYREPREQVRLFRTRLPVENQRQLFLSFVAKINELSRRPEWYNTLQDNCTTGVLERTRAYSGRGRYNWKILLSGFAAEYAYEVGMLDTSLPFDELSRLCLVNAKAEAADRAENFSTRIREGLPMPRPYTKREFDSGM